MNGFNQEQAGKSPETDPIKFKIPSKTSRGKKDRTRRYHHRRHKQQQTCIDKLLVDEKNCSDFGDRNLIFKATGVQRILKNALSSSFIISPEKID